MVAKPHGYQLKYPEVYLNNNKLEYVEKVKYLGVIICNDLKDDEDMLRHCMAFLQGLTVSFGNFTTVQLV